MFYQTTRKQSKLQSQSIQSFDYILIVQFQYIRIIDYLQFKSQAQAMKIFTKSIKSFVYKVIMQRSAMTLCNIKQTYHPPNFTESHLLTTCIQLPMSSQPSRKEIMKYSYQGPGFYIQQLLTSYLAIYSYYIESQNQCFLIDPDLHTKVYNDLIEFRGKKLVGIFVSHYHADYISSQYELAKNHKCNIYMGPKSTPSDFVITTKDKQTVKLGKVTLQVMHTPGHTQQSSCLLLIDQDGKKNVIFTGDTVFFNGVGRPNMAVKSKLSVTDLAGMLFESLQKIKTLDDDLKILAGHGSGPGCEKTIGKGDTSTLGEQKESNYGLIIGDKPEFVNALLAQMQKPPQYFGYNVNLNKLQPFVYDQAQKKALKNLTPQQVLQHYKKDNCVIIDVRGTAELKDGIIENSLCIGYEGSFANWVATLLSSKDSIILLGSEQQAKQSITKLLKIGYINILGYANFPISEWKAKGYSAVIPHFVDQISQPNTVILDVRKPSQWQQKGVVQGSHRIQLSDLYNHTQKLDKSKGYVTHCQSGYRAKIAYSYLLSQGYKAMAYPYQFDTIFKSGSVKRVQI